MLGAFETFFWQHGLLEESLLAVFLHGKLCLGGVALKYLAKRIAQGRADEIQQIVVGAGIEYLLGCLAHLFSDGMAAIENPGYFRTRTVLQNSGIPCTLMDIDREGLPADALAALRAEEAALLARLADGQGGTGIASASR